MVMKLEVGMTGIEELSRRLDIMGLPDSEARDTLYTEVFTELGRVLKGKLEANTPRGATGRLALSTDFRIKIADTDTQGEREYILEVVQTAKSRNFTYRPITVSGRLPGKMPPALALRGWVQLRWGLSAVETNRAAFRLARHIASQGTQPNDYTAKTVTQSQGDIEAASIRLGQELTVFISDF